ncbi:SDR family oxidoreductase [Exiguobacterium antarcticum]|uniref:SDR family oxidoreductase n=1 Tax=Exiguobacterium antarcticum TaxID=132920 RepID=UPI000285EE4E|nr:SDR family oxidoreductase [Exiguobacterium antarcticum]AFS71772.1 Male sterility domain protein [Exiguobacterium antarcticum B7]
MKRTYLMTGFPGFLATKLIERLALVPEQIECFYLLHLKHEHTSAVAQKKHFLKTTALQDEQLILIEGDITKDGLGLPNEIRQELAFRVTHVFHLAALYDLATSYDTAFRINVIGTSNVTRLAHTFTHLERYVYFSTAYVSGLRTGTVFENELTHHTAFKNAYEETKYLAEVRFRKEVGTLPYTIIRPGIVVGHSQTGETPKWDGVYFVLNALRLLNKFSPLPYAGRANALVNLVPYDYVVNATTYLSHAPSGIQKTYHLTDPFPHGARAIYEMLHVVYYGSYPRGVVPFRLVTSVLTPRVTKRLQMQRQTLDYFVHPVQYDTSNTLRDLDGTGIICPDLAELIPRLVTYYKKNHPQMEETT